MTHLFDEVVAGAPGERHDSECGVLIGVTAERGSVVDEQVGDVPALIPLVSHRLLAVCPHDGPADFMDDEATWLDCLSPIGCRFSPDLPPDGFDHLGEGLVHVQRLLQFVVRELPVEA